MAKQPKKKPKDDSIEKKNPITIEALPDGTYAFHGRSLNPSRDKNLALAPYSKALWDYGIQLHIIPNDEQIQKINKNIGCARFVRNDYLSTRKELYESEHRTMNYNDYAKDRLKALKTENPWLKEADKFALEGAIKHVDAAYANFFEKRTGFPKFASKYAPNGNRYTTQYTNDNIKLYVEDGIAYVQLPKVGRVRAVLPKGKTLDGLVPHGAKILNATVIRKGNSYVVSLCIETVIDKPKPLATVRADRLISMDMGLKWFCDYSNGHDGHEHVENPKWIYKHAKKLRRFQRMAARRRYDKTKHRGSKNWQKAQVLVAKEQRKTADQRKDFHHKLSKKIADMCDVFVCEDLNIKGMMKNRHLSKSIASVGWGQFLTFVKYKMERKGAVFLKVDRWFPSSKLCGCGYKYDLTLKERWWICPKCHTFNDRDDHAVDNLRAEGIRLLAERGVAVI